ncbi:MAG: cysteine desulfurase [Candidatus Margulisiibacteriota bacterium]|jgi:cysteine desulfurase/selenocysteine lyase
MNLNSEKFIKNEFPELQHHKDLVYLDSAATTLKPRAVINRLKIFYEFEYATIHRGIYELSQNATQLFDEARNFVKDFIKAKSSSEIVFVRGTTEAINLVTTSFAGWLFTPGSEIIVSEIEHHANFVPWQMLAQEKGLVLKTIRVQDDGSLDLNHLKELITPQTKLLALTHISNVLGIVNPIKEIVKIAHDHEVAVLIDGAQAVAHLPVDVQDLDCDFYCFSGHKIYGPTGIGVLYGKKELFKKMRPYQFGGDMVEQVNLLGTTFKEAPEKFEAGTPAIAEVIGLHAALQYVKSMGLAKIKNHEDLLLKKMLSELAQIPDIKIFGTAKEKSGIIAFNLGDIHPHDVGTILSEAGVAVRVGHHCSQLTMKRYQVPATVRVSFGIYNDLDDVDTFIKALKKVQEIIC